MDGRPGQDLFHAHVMPALGAGTHAYFKLVQTREAAAYSIASAT